MCACCMLQLLNKGFLASLHFVKLALAQQSCVDHRYLALKWSSNQKRTVSYKAHQQLVSVPSLNWTCFTSRGVGVWLCELTEVWVATL